MKREKRRKKGKKIIQETGYLGNWIFREISFVQLLIDNDNFEKKKERNIFKKCSRRKFSFFLFHQKIIKVSRNKYFCALPFFPLYLVTNPRQNGSNPFEINVKRFVAVSLKRDTHSDLKTSNKKTWNISRTLSRLK